MADLEALPIEVVQLIGDYSSYQSLCSLSCVNHDLRKICIDRFVLRAIVRLHHLHIFVYADNYWPNTTLMWWRLAFAASEAFKVSPEDLDGITWLPQMIALYGGLETCPTVNMCLATFRSLLSRTGLVISHRWIRAALPSRSLRFCILFCSVCTFIIDNPTRGRRRLLWRFRCGVCRLTGHRRYLS
jgi:hypothetical protein